MNASGEGQFCYQWKLSVIVFSWVFLLIPYYVTHAALTDGLVGHWTFDGKDTTWTSSTTGTTRDLSGNGNTGTLTNLNRATAPILGKLGQGLNFDGTNAIIKAGTSTLLTTLQNSYSMSVWVRRASVTNDTNIIGNYNGYGQPSTYIRLNQYNTSFYFYDDSIETSAINDRRWHHIVTTREHTTGFVALYIDGALATSTTSTVGVASYGQNGYVTIGGTWATFSTIYSFSGTLDDARVYNRVLSATEITQLYKQGATKLGVTQPRGATTTTNVTGIGAGLVGHWTFDGKDTTWTSATTGTTRDVSGSGRTGTLTNMNRATAPKAGKIGQGLLFDGSNDSVASIGVAVREYSLSFWLKRQNNGSAGYNSVIACTGTTGAGYYGWYDSGLMRWCYTNSSGFATNRLGAIAVPPANTWVHVVLTVGVSGADMSMKQYFNNKLINTDFSSPGGLGTSTITTIGAGHINLKGSLDDFRIYNRVLSVTEIDELYKLGATKLGVTPSRTNATSTGAVGLGAGLVGHWTFDGKDTTWTSSTTGTTRDLSGNGNTGTLSAMNRSASPRSGKVGQAFMFSNASRVETANYNILGTTASTSFTVSSWFNVASTTLNHMYIIEYGGGAAFVVEKVPSLDTMRCKLRDPSVGFLYSNSVARPQIGQWHLFSCVYNASNKTLVFNVDDSNNTPVSVSSFSSFDNPGQLFLGGRSYGTYNGFVGSLDDIRVYNRALSATEIQKLYKLGQTRMR